MLKSTSAILVHRDAGAIRGNANHKNVAHLASNRADQSVTSGRLADSEKIRLSTELVFSHLFWS